MEQSHAAHPSTCFRRSLACTITARQERGSRTRREGREALTVQERIEPAIKPFDSFGAYQRERAHCRNLERTLSKALALLQMECSRREGRGEDVAHIRAFIKEAADV